MKIKKKLEEINLSTLNSRQESTHPTCRFAVCGSITSHSTKIRLLNDSEEDMTKVVVFSVKKSDIDNVEYSAFSSVFSFYSFANKSTMINSFRDQIKMVIHYCFI